MGTHSDRIHAIVAESMAALQRNRREMAVRLTERLRECATCGRRCPGITDCLGMAKRPPEPDAEAAPADSCEGDHEIVGGE